MPAKRGFLYGLSDRQLSLRDMGCRKTHAVAVVVGGRPSVRDSANQDELWWGAWLTFSNECQLARARWWLADAGLRPATDADGLVAT